jgi:CheY-like chemotaxis protein
MKESIILVAEDEAAIRGLTAEFLAGSGFKVVEAANAEAALALIKSQRIDLVFTDINMPGLLQGDSLADWLSVHRPDLPVILTSGVARPTLRGTDRLFIAKPYRLNHVEAQIRHLLH